MKISWISKELYINFHQNLLSVFIIILRSLRERLGSIGKLTDCFANLSAFLNDFQYLQECLRLCLAEFLEIWKTWKTFFSNVLFGTLRFVFRFSSFSTFKRLSSLFFATFFLFSFIPFSMQKSNFHALLSTSSMHWCHYSHRYMVFQFLRFIFV